MRFIIDTNLLVSIIIRPGSLPEKTLEKVLKQGRLCFSETTRQELEQVVMRDKFDKYISKNDRFKKLENLFGKADFIETKEHFVVACRDPKDDMFLELGLAAKADCIITGDLDLLELNPFRGIPILTASQFLERF